MSKEFGNHLRKIRMSKGFSQQNMAEMLGVHRSAYTYYETGKSEPSFEKLKKICDYLQVDFNTMLDY